MKNYRWWLRQSVVYGLVAVTGIALMWSTGDWSAARISWLFGGISGISLIVGAVLYSRAKRPVQR